MANSRAKYRPIPSSEDQLVHRNTQIEDDGDNDVDSTIECTSGEAQAGWTYFFLGCAILLPWSAMTHATPFFLSRLVGSPLYQTFSSSMASVYTLTNLVCQFYCTLTSKQSSPSRRIFMSITLSITLISSLCFSTFVRGTPPGFFVFVLLNAFFLAISVGYLSTAVYVGAAILGPSYIRSVLAGQAAVGVAVSALQLIVVIISLWDSSSSSITTIITDGGDGKAEAMAAGIFFGVSTVFYIITLAAYAWLTRLPFYKLVTDMLERNRQVASSEELTGPVANDSRLSMGSSSDIFRVLRQNWIFMFSVMYVFAVTLAIYPAIAVRVRSTDPDIHPLLFISVHFLVFNVGDLIGRYSCSFPRLIVWSAKKILAMAFLRTLFIPLFMLCNLDRPAMIPISPIIGSDILFMLIPLAMGCTNGYVATLALVAASSLERNPKLRGRHEDVDIAATLGGAFLNLGLALGSLASFGVQALMM